MPFQMIRRSPTASDCRQRLRQIHEEVETLERRLSQLKYGEQRVKEHLDGLVLASSPIGKVSEDILREIFFHTLPDDEERRVPWASSSIRRTVAPMLLCFVSKKWREVAMGYSSLWGFLRLLIPPRHELEEAHNIGPQFTGETAADTELAVKSFLTRWREITKVSPLKLELIMNCNRDPCFPSQLFSAIDFRRLTSLSLCRVPIAPLHTLQPGSFPLLEDLIIHLFTPRDHRWGGWGPILAFLECPQLRRVAVDKLVSKGHTTIILPITQLTHLIVRSASWEYFIDYMEKCPNLQYMHLVVPSNRERPSLTPRQDTWHWPTLTHLSIDCTSNPPDAYPFLLDHIDLSRLKSLQIFEAGLRWANGLEDTFLQRIHSMTSLERLSLRCSEEYEMEDALELFDYTPTITTLEITAQPMDDQYREVYERLADLFNSLTSSPDILPRLHTLILELACGSIGNLEASVLDFIESRSSTEAQTRLRRVVLRITRGAFTLPVNQSVCIPELQSDGEEGGLIVELMDVPPEGNKYYKKTNWIINDLELGWPEVADLFTVGEVMAGRLQ
ncbi:hypothetical protein DFP72DRAFT_187575 [Ephemerocybe angulata]|uniref:F-box domain-containing protein n=1 Tax=Ephemerocybe angulata TaxID=980116 RepID=A0A8H6I595_9AGAR|nr:hypothetical protein DFP72DRAFT_187575 [Tulosesus angulatus]